MLLFATLTRPTTGPLLSPREAQQNLPRRRSLTPNTMADIHGRAWQITATRCWREAKPLTPSTPQPRCRPRPTIERLDRNALRAAMAIAG